MAQSDVRKSGLISQSGGIKPHFKRFRANKEAPSRKKVASFYRNFALYFDKAESETKLDALHEQYKLQPYNYITYNSCKYLPDLTQEAGE